MKKVNEQAAAADSGDDDFDYGTPASNTLTQKNILRGLGFDQPGMNLNTVDFGHEFAKALIKSTNIAGKAAMNAAHGSGATEMQIANFEGLKTFLSEVVKDTIFTPETYTDIGQTILDQFGGIRPVTGAEVQQSAENHFYIQTGVGDPVAIGNEILRLIKMNPQYEAGSLGSLAP